MQVGAFLPLAGEPRAAERLLALWGATVGYAGRGLRRGGVPEVGVREDDERGTGAVFLSRR